MSIVYLFLWLITVCLAGYAVIDLLGKKNNVFFTLEKIGLCFPVCLGIVAIELIFLAYINIPFSLVSIIGFLLFLFVIYAICLFLYRPKTVELLTLFPPLKNWGRLEKAIFIGLACQITYVFIRSLIIPLEGFDAIANYAIKAKIFFKYHTIPEDFYIRFAGVIRNIEYPLLLPLAETSLYEFLGSVNDQATKIIFPMFYLSSLIIFYCVCRRFVTHKSALLFTFLLATLRQFVEFGVNGYAEILESFYFSGSLFYLFIWMTSKEKRGAILALSFLLSGLAMLTKAEGLITVCASGCVVIVFLLINRFKHFKPIAFYLISLSLAATVYILVIKFHQLQINHAVGIVTIDTLKTIEWIRMIDILNAYQQNIFAPKDWNLLWIFWIILLGWNVKQIITAELKFLLIILISVFVFYTGIYLVTENYRWVMDKTSTRFIVHFVPIIALHCALLFKHLKLDY